MYFLFSLALLTDMNRPTTSHGHGKPTPKDDERYRANFQAVALHFEKEALLQVRNNNMYLIRYPVGKA